MRAIFRGGEFLFLLSFPRGFSQTSDIEKRRTCVSFFVSSFYLQRMSGFVSCLKSRGIRSPGTSSSLRSETRWVLIRPDNRRAPGGLQENTDVEPEEPGRKTATRTPRHFLHRAATRKTKGTSSRFATNRKRRALDYTSECKWANRTQTGAAREEESHTKWPW